MTRRDPLDQAVKALSRAAGERIARHPQGHLLRGQGERLELTLELPVAALDDLADATEQARLSLERELENLIAHRAAFRPGRIFCLRCAAADCEHSTPPSGRHIFAGYGPTGLPRFQDYGQWLLEIEHPAVDRLYSRPPKLITVITSGRDLERQLLGAFRDRHLDYKIHGQVTAGWFAVPGANGGPPDGIALTFQVISSAHPGPTAKKSRSKKKGGAKKGTARRRLGLNVLGAGPEGEPLRDIYDRLGSIPWSGIVRWGQSVLENIERSQGRKNATPEKLSRRIEGVLGGIARRLDQGRRSRDRRTEHAEKRHQEGDRPTRMALRDLTRANDDNILFDTRRDTLIVLGERGRAHVFNTRGKLVTSIRYSSDSIDKKKNLEIWRQASDQEIRKLRNRLT